jgi:hypothetical protein
MLAKNDAAVRARLENIENKLVSMEDMLDRLLIATAGKSNQPSGAETSHATRDVTNAEKDDDDSDGSEDGTDEDDEEEEDDD